MSSTINWLLALVLAVMLSSAWLLDGDTIDDHSTERAQADSLQDSIKAEAVQARFARAAQAVCGINAAWMLIDPTTVQCLTHRGRKTTVSQVQP